MSPVGFEMTVGVVDDDASVRRYLGDTLSSAGYVCRSFESGPTALQWMTSGQESADLLLSDVNMPGMNGLDLLRRVKALKPRLPFILVSGLCDLATAQGALREGATDYLLKPVLPDDLINLVSKHLDIVHSERFEAVREALKRSVATTPGAETGQACRLTPIFDALGFKRFETLKHSQRVAAFALLIARKLDLNPKALRALEIGALLHDIGKAGIPHNTLMKAGKLNDEEQAIMKMHPHLGLYLLAGVPGLEREAEIVYSHHERFDGTGYPEKLAGEAIPLAARIFSVADTLDAIVSDRCYRAGQPLAAARVEIRRGAGTQFDPAIVDLFDEVEDCEIESVLKRFPDVAWRPLAD